MRSFITGADGFIGSALARALREEGDEIMGFSRAGRSLGLGITVVPGDIRSREEVAAALRRAAPDRVFHLAAQSNIPHSLEHPEETFDVNVQGSLHLFEAVRAHAPKATVLSVGSSAEYGASGVHQGMIDEKTPLVPSSPYGASKVSQGTIAGLYARAYGLRVMHVRPFAVIGPKKVGDAVSDFCRAVVGIEAGGTKAVPVGNLDVVRDFVDVRDCVSAFRLIAERGIAGETYNVCNGVGVSLRQILHELQQAAGTPFAVVEDPARRRPADDHRLVGNNAKLCALEYQRRYDLPSTVRATLDYWRVRERTRQAIRT